MLRYSGISEDKRDHAGFSLRKEVNFKCNEECYDFQCYLAHVDMVKIQMVFSLAFSTR